MSNFLVRAAHIERIDWDNIRLTKPSETLRGYIRKARIESLYALLEDERWEQEVKNLIENDLKRTP